MHVAHFLQYLVLRAFQLPLSLVPLSFARSSARVVGRFVFSVLRFRRRVALENIRRAFPDRSTSFWHEVARQSYESVAVTLFEFMLFPGMEPGLLRSIVTITNAPELKSAFARGKGLILLTAHYGSWECFAQASGMTLGGHGTLLAKTQSNPYVQRQVDAWRRRLGFRTTASNLAVRDVLKVLHDGGWVVIAADQSAPKESPRIPFFGRMIPTFQGPASFSLKTGAPIMLGLARRQPDDTYVVEFEHIPSEDLSPDSEASVVELTRRHVAATERRILEDPGQWMWMHRRWKHAEAIAEGASE